MVELMEVVAFLGISMWNMNLGVRLVGACYVEPAGHFGVFGVGENLVGIECRVSRFIKFKVVQIVCSGAAARL